LRVLYWFQGAIDIFRTSKLPGLGKELQANIHESVFAPLATAQDDDDDNDNDNVNIADVDESLKLEAIAS